MTHLCALHYLYLLLVPTLVIACIIVLLVTLAEKTP